MMTTRTRRIALVGVDGSGKSTVIKRLVERTGQADLAVIHFPKFHANADAPLAGLSRAIETFSSVADTLGSYELKALALYMQATLYGPVESAIVNAFAPAALLCERHPVIDSLAYGPFYKRMFRTELDEATWQEPLRAALDGRLPGAYDAIRGWHRSEMRRLGRSSSFWDVAREICVELDRPPAEILPELTLRYRTSVPDIVVLLDATGEEAERRILARGGEGHELHETAEYLNLLRARYQTSLAALARLRSEMRIVTLATSELSVDDTVEQIVGIAGLQPARRPAATWQAARESSAA